MMAIVSVKSKFDKLGYFLLVPLVGILITVLFGIDKQTPLRDSGLLMLLHGVFMTSGLWIGCMIIVHFLWHKYPWEQKPVTHLILEVILILVYTNLFSLGIYSLELHLGIIEPIGEELFISAVITNLITLFITGMHEAVEFYKQWKYNFSKSVRLEKDNIEAKYEMLKTQVNPHFLFNSLNSLVDLVDDNSEAVNYINNLADFLRYMLKSRDRQVVLLREEVGILEQYLALQKSRFREGLHYEINVDEKFYHFSTPPLVLQMLVENCIKHNVLSAEKPLKIRVSAEKNRVTVENNYQPKVQDFSTGQGLKNISERYRYFTSEQLKINENNESFKVSIPLLKVDL